MSVSLAANSGSRDRLNVRTRCAAAYPPARCAAPMSGRYRRRGPSPGRSSASPGAADRRRSALPRAPPSRPKSAACQACPRTSPPPSTPTIRARRRSRPARELVAKRAAWLDPPELVDVVPEVVPGYPDRLLPEDARAAAPPLKVAPDQPLQYARHADRRVARQRAPRARRRGRRRLWLARRPVRRGRAGPAARAQPRTRRHQANFRPTFLPGPAGRPGGEASRAVCVPGNPAILRHVVTPDPGNTYLSAQW